MKQIETAEMIYRATGVSTKVLDYIWDGRTGIDRELNLVIHVLTDDELSTEEKRTIIHTALMSI